MTESNDSLNAKISALGLKIGNQVLASTGLAGTPNQNLYVDANDLLAGTYPVLVNQPSAAGTVMEVTSSATEGNLTSTIVAAGSSTVTQKDFCEF